MPAFDARSAKALAAGDHLTIDEAPGLRLVATETRRTWTYRYKSPVDDRMRQQRLGHWPAMSYAAALAAWETARRLRGEGADPALEARAAKGVARRQMDQARAVRRQQAYTVRTVCDEYLASYAGTVALKTYAELARLFGRELDGLADKPAADLTRADAYGLLDSMRARAVVAGRLRQGLGAAWDQALDAGRLPAETPNWWRLILRGRLVSKGKVVQGKSVGVVKRALDDAELRLLLPFLPNFSRDVEDVLRLYLWTACRGAEIVAMERGEITTEVDGTWWTVPRAKLKMRRNPLTVDLRVPLVGDALDVVKRRLAATAGRAAPWLFPSPGQGTGHIQQKAVGLAVWSHMPHAGTRPEWVRPRLPVAAWAPHDLRRTVRTQLAAMGCPPDVAEAILGHQQPGVQGTYNRHSYDAERRLWLTRWAGRLAEISR